MVATVKAGTGNLITSTAPLNGDAVGGQCSAGGLMDALGQVALCCA